MFSKNIIKERLKNITNYFRYCNVESEKLKIQKYIIGTKPREFAKGKLHTGDLFVSFEFKSNLGTVKVIVSQDVDNDRYSIDYSNYAGSTVFEIITGLKTTVKPQLGVNLLAKDVDLAILELEEYLQGFGDINSIIKEKKQQEKALQKLHNEEVKKLIKGLTNE